MFSSFFYFLFSRVNNENEQSSNLLLFLVFTLSLMNSGKRYGIRKSLVTFSLIICLGLIYPVGSRCQEAENVSKPVRSTRILQLAFCLRFPTLCFQLFHTFFLVFLVSFVSARCIEIISKIVDDHERWWET